MIKFAVSKIISDHSDSFWVRQRILGSKAKENVRELSVGALGAVDINYLVEYFPLFHIQLIEDIVWFIKTPLSHKKKEQGLQLALGRCILREALVVIVIQPRLIVVLQAKAE